jgi:hypothetical protein
MVPIPYFWQPPAPSHFLLVPQEAAPWSVQILWGSSAPATTAVQWPREDSSEQLLHGLVQASAQQTPSTQKLLMHSAAPPQGWPRPLRPQLPAMQTLPMLQSSSPAQTPRQAPAAHRYGGQSWMPGLRQVPRPSQVPAVLRRSPLQEGATQTVSAA